MQMNVPRIRRNGWPHKVYIFLSRITSRTDCLSVSHVCHIESWQVRNSEISSRFNRQMDQTWIVWPLLMLIHKIYNTYTEQVERSFNKLLLTCIKMIKHIFKTYKIHTRKIVYECWNRRLSILKAYQLLQSCQSACFQLIWPSDQLTLYQSVDG